MKNPKYILRQKRNILFGIYDSLTIWRGLQRFTMRGSRLGRALASLDAAHRRRKRVRRLAAVAT